MAWKQSISMKRAIEAFLVYKQDKTTIDLEATQSKFNDYSAKYNAHNSQAAETELIAKCIHALFDDQRGIGLNVGFIQSHTFEKIKAINPDLGDPRFYPFLTKRIKDVLKSMAGDDKPLDTRGHAYFRKADQKPAV